MKVASFLNKRQPMRRTRILFLFIAFFLLTTIVEPGPDPEPGGISVARLTATPVALNDSDRAQDRIGRFRYRRGWVLRSDDRRFGGLSAMRIDDGRVTAISDAGFLFDFPLPAREGAGRVRIVPLQGGRWFRIRSAVRDAESIVLADATAWLGFESANAVVRYRRSDWTVEAGHRPVAMRRWRGNSGPEAMVRLADGRFLVFSEGRASGPPFSPVVLFDGDPAAAGTRTTALRYRRPDGFRPTDAALLPDGRLLILNRRFSWLSGISAKLVVADISRLRPGGTIVGRDVAELRSPLVVDNMEALSIARERGRTIVRIASDDNYMAIQRTLLLEFELME